MKIWIIHKVLFVASYGFNKSKALIENCIPVLDSHHFTEGDNISMTSVENIKAEPEFIGNVTYEQSNKIFITFFCRRSTNEFCKWG